MSDGLDAMRRQRETNRRGKPASMHPRRQPQEQQDAETEATETTRTNTSPTKPKGSPKGSPKPTSKPPTSAPSGSGGELEAKAANNAALGWSAAARRQAERAGYLATAIKVAAEAGASQERLQAVLNHAEATGGGVELPTAVWQAAGLAPSADRPAE